MTSRVIAARPARCDRPAHHEHTRHRPSSPPARGLPLATGHGLLAASVADTGTTGAIGLLAPALVLIGAGMGLVITPLTATVLAGLQPERAGAAAGAQATMQQVGNALGVAVTGVVFFGALHGGFAHAFELSLLQIGWWAWRSRA